MRTALRWVYDNFLEWITGGLLAVILVLTTFQVTARYVFSSPLSWVEEFCQLLLVWAVMIGAAAAVKTNAHLTVDVILERLKGFPRQAVIILINIGVLILAVGMTWYGFQFYWRTAGDYSTSLGFARNLYYLPIPVAGILVAVFIFPATLLSLRKPTGDDHSTPAID